VPSQRGHTKCGPWGLLSPLLVIRWQGAGECAAISVAPDRQTGGGSDGRGSDYAPAGRCDPVKRGGQSPIGAAYTAPDTRHVLRCHAGRRNRKHGTHAARHSGGSGLSPDSCCGRQPLHASPTGWATPTWASVHTDHLSCLAESDVVRARVVRAKHEKAPPQPRGRRDCWHGFRRPRSVAVAPLDPRTRMRPWGRPAHAFATPPAREVLVATPPGRASALRGVESGRETCMHGRTLEYTQPL
jgi:hypothetical protein